MVGCLLECTPTKHACMILYHKQSLSLTLHHTNVWRGIALTLEDTPPYWLRPVIHQKFVIHKWFCITKSHSLSLWQLLVIIMQTSFRVEYYRLYDIIAIKTAALSWRVRRILPYTILVKETYLYAKETYKRLPNETYKHLPNETNKRLFNDIYTSDHIAHSTGRPVTHWHCNPLLHTATHRTTHCSTPQHPATYCKIPDNRALSAECWSLLVDSCWANIRLFWENIGLLWGNVGLFG